MTIWEWGFAIFFLVNTLVGLWTVVRFGRGVMAKWHR